MRILFLAPHPFFQERGTPIAVRLILEALSKRGDEVDVVTFHEGETPGIPGVTIHRTFPLAILNGMRPGFSWKKLIGDALLFFQVIRKMSKKRYDIIHAVEESVYIALVVKWVFRKPYIYDMDSSLAQQMMEKHPGLVMVKFLLNACESLVIRHARAVLPVCETLANLVRAKGQGNVMVLHDIPLGKEMSPQKPLSLRKELGLTGSVVMYVGNLESYQGIDLLLDSFSLVLKQKLEVDLVIIGGNQEDVRRYAHIAEGLTIHRRVHFLGPKPIHELASWLSEADILVSPRITGTNTPMKVYSYLQSGVPVVATDLVTHTQVMDERVAVLVAATPPDFSSGILRLLNDQRLGNVLGRSAQELIRVRYSPEAFRHKVNHLYDWLQAGGQTSLAATPVLSAAPNLQA